MLTGLAAGLVGGAATLGTAIGNWFSQKNTQEETWEREDNAVQRRVADLRAAGLSPTLAAGSAAVSGLTSAPQFQGGAVADALGSAAQLQSIKNAREENANLRTSRQVMYADMSEKFANMQRAIAEANYYNANANTTTIDGMLKSEMMREIGARIPTYESQVALNNSKNELNFWDAMRAAQDFDIIAGTGTTPTNGSALGVIGRGLHQGFTNMLNMFKLNQPAYHKVNDYRR